MAKRRIVRSQDNRMLAGICGGIAEYFNIDPTLVRLGWVLLTVAYFMGFFAYILCWFIIPEEE